VYIRNKLHACNVGEKYVVSASNPHFGVFFAFSVMGVGVFSWRHEEACRHGGCRVVWKRGGGKKVCMHACMGDTWVLFGIGLGKASERGREGGIGVQGFGRSGVFSSMYLMY